MDTIAKNALEACMTWPEAQAKGREETRQGGEAGPLGNHGNKSTAQGRGNDSADFSKKLWQLQRTMWGITQFKRLAGCHRWIKDRSGGAYVQWSPGKAKWSGLQNSASVWASPVAAVRISKLRAAEIEQAVKNWKKDSHHSVEFLTLTLRHTRDQSLKEVWDAISYAWRGITQGASWRGGVRMLGDKQRFGIEHWLRSTEVTVGEHGWHVHVHVLLFLKKSLDQDNRDFLTERFFERWKNAALRKGFQAPLKKHGIRIEEAIKRGDATAMGAYIAKGAVSSIGQEIARGQQKHARTESSRTPFQILADLADPTNSSRKRDLALWYEWEENSLGRRQMSFSKGAKEELRLDHDDQNLLEENDKKDFVDAFSIAQVTAENWSASIPGTTISLSDSIDARKDVLDYVSHAKNPDDAAKRASYVLGKYGILHTSQCINLELVEDTYCPPNQQQSREIFNLYPLNDPDIE